MSCMLFITRTSHDTGLPLWLFKGPLAKKHWLLHCLGLLPPKTDQQDRALVTFHVIRCHPLKQPHNLKVNQNLTLLKLFLRLIHKHYPYTDDDNNYY